MGPIRGCGLVLIDLEGVSGGAVCGIAEGGRSGDGGLRLVEQVLGKNAVETCAVTRGWAIGA